MSTVARRPEETTEVFVHHFNAGDADDLLAAQPGAAASGDELRAGLGNFLTPGASITANTRHAYVTGDTALLVIDWVIEGEDPSGHPLRFPGTSTDVVRRDGGGVWRCIIDNPHGIS